MFVRSAIITCLITMVGSMAFGQTYYDLSFTEKNVGTMKYRVYVPAGYNPSSAEGTPVILYLHSAAERGDNVTDIFQSYNNWVPELISATQTGDHQAIVVMPESGSWQTWAAVNNGDNWGVGDYTNATQGAIDPRLQLAVDITKKVIGTYNTDSNRVYITGPSMGGYGTWDAMARYSTLFAAGAPLSGGGNLDAAGTTLANMPIWMYHGANDSLIPASNDDALFIKMLQAGGNPIYTRNPTGGHDGWDTFYTPGTYTTSNPNQATGVGTDFYDWLFAQSLDQRSPVAAPSAIQPYVIGFGTGGSANMIIGNTADGNKALVYNRVSSFGASNLKNMLGYSSSVAVLIKSGTPHYDTNTLAVSSKVAALFPASVLSKSIYVTNGDALVLNITGLDDNLFYTIDLFGATQNTLSGTALFQLSGRGTQEKSLWESGNTDTILSFQNMQSVNGVISLTMSVESGLVAYLNAMMISSSTTVPEPGSLSLLAIGGLALLRRRSSKR